MSENAGTPGVVYVLIFVALLMLTLVTVEVAFYDLQILSFWVAVAIATTKAGLVVLFFMHVRHASTLTKLFVGAGFFWLLILFAFLLSDYYTRGWERPPAWWG